MSHENFSPSQKKRRREKKSNNTNNKTIEYDITYKKKRIHFRQKKRKNMKTLIVRNEKFA